MLYSHRAPDGAWLPGGASSSGAGVLAQRFADRDLDDLGRRAEAHEDTDVLAYPLVSRGERFPFAAADADPFVVGEPRTRPSSSRRCCRASRSSSGCASTTSTCSARPRAAS